jgi:hypothetical protein
MNDGVQKNGSRTQYAAETLADHSPALTWLSLVGLLSSRAQLRVTRHHDCTQRRKLEYGA